MTRKRDDLNADPFRLQRAAERKKAVRPSAQEKANGESLMDQVYKESGKVQGWHIKDVIARVREVSAHALTVHRQQNEISLSCGVGPTKQDIIRKENAAISAELERRRQLDIESLLREEGARRELDRRERAQHTCTKTMSSMNCHACNAGVPYPHETQDDRLVISRKALVVKVTDAVRRIDRELAVLRQDLDRLRSFD